MNAHSDDYPPPPIQGTTHNQNICDHLHTYTQWANLKNILHDKKTLQRNENRKNNTTTFIKNLSQGTRTQSMNEQHWQIHFKMYPLLWVRIPTATINRNHGAYKCVYALQYGDLMFEKRRFSRCLSRLLKLCKNAADYILIKGAVWSALVHRLFPTDSTTPCSISYTSSLSCRVNISPQMPVHLSQCVQCVGSWWTGLPSSSLRPFLTFANSKGMCSEAPREPRSAI